MAHLQALQKIADEHGGNRAAGTAGFEATVDYAADVLRRAGFDVSTPTYAMEGDEDVAPGPAATSSRRRAPETPTTS